MDVQAYRQEYQALSQFLLDLAEEQKQPLHKLFDLVVGCNTGGLMSLLIAQNRSAEIPKLFEEDTQRRWFASVIDSSLQISPFLEPLYVERSKRKLWQEVFPLDTPTPGCFSLPLLSYAQQTIRILHSPSKMKAWEMAHATTNTLPFFPVPSATDWIDVSWNVVDSTLIGYQEAQRLFSSVENVPIRLLTFHLSLNPKDPQLDLFSVIQASQAKFQLQTAQQHISQEARHQALPHRMLCVRIQSITQYKDNKKDVNEFFQPQHSRAWFYDPHKETKE